MSDKSVFTYLEAMSDKVGALGSVVIAQLPEGLKTEVSLLGGQPVLGDGAPVKTLATQTQMSSLVSNIVTRCCPGLLALSTIPQGQDNWQI